MKKKDVFELAKEFCEFSHLQDNMGGEEPNITFAMADYFITPEEQAEWTEGWDWHDWDPIEDVLTMVSPQMLAYILVVAKSFWEKKGEK